MATGFEINKLFIAKDDPMMHIRYAKFLTGKEFWNSFAVVRLFLVSVVLE